MGEVSDDIELDLGLSIGGSFQKSENEKPHAPPQVARDIHAPPMQEAKRKREESRVSDDERVERNGSEKPDPNRINGGSGSYPVVFPYPPIQYVPLSNAFAIPYVVPYFAPQNAAAPSGGGGGNESFVPFQGNLSSGVDLQNGCELEQNGGGGDRKATSNGSNLSSSVVSDNRSSSHEGGETRSNSSQSPPDQPQIEKSPAPTNTLPSNPSGPNGEANASMHTKKPTSTKPPKPQTQTPPLPQMPCVSATGPNGKIVTGLLHRYTTNEVSIVCVCHGSSFSPAEFVAHAGGTDVTNPLKHITMIPSAFG